jgi:hypothetical protein
MLPENTLKISKVRGYHALSGERENSFIEKQNT